MQNPAIKLISSKSSACQRRRKYINGIICHVILFFENLAIHISVSLWRMKISNCLKWFVNAKKLSKTWKSRPEMRLRFLSKLTTVRIETRKLPEMRPRFGSSSCPNRVRDSHQTIMQYWVLAIRSNTDRVKRLEQENAALKEAQTKNSESQTKTDEKVKAKADNMAKQDDFVTFGLNLVSKINDLNTAVIG